MTEREALDLIRATATRSVPNCINLQAIDRILADVPPAAPQKAEELTADEIKSLLRSKSDALIRADKAERAIDDERERANKADTKRQRARQHCIQVIGQCIGGGDSQLAADALFNMLGLLYDEADDKQLYPPVPAQD